MAAKSYTNLLQSRKLTEILPIESADQIWERIAIVGANIDVPEEMQYRHNGDISFILSSRIGIPCWSLAVLLDVLPHRIDDRHALVSGKLSANEGWYVCYDDDNGDIDYYVHNSNLIDACYEMIMKLHEQKLL